MEKLVHSEPELLVEGNDKHSVVLTSFGDECLRKLGRCAKQSR